MSINEKNRILNDYVSNGPEQKKLKKLQVL